MPIHRPSLCPVLGVLLLAGFTSACSSDEDRATDESNGNTGGVLGDAGQATGASSLDSDAGLAGAAADAGTGGTAGSNVGGAQTGGAGGALTGGALTGGTSNLGGTAGDCVAPADYPAADVADLEEEGFEEGRKASVVATVDQQGECTALWCDDVNPCCNECGWWNFIGLSLDLYSSDPDVEFMCHGTNCDCEGTYCVNGLPESCRWLEPGMQYLLWGELGIMDGWRESLIVEGYCKVE
jgi:hypothetical protein